MTKSEYFNEAKKIVKKALADRAETQKALDEVNEKIGNTRQYTREYINKTFVPMRKKLTVQLVDSARLASEKIEKLTANYVTELEAANRLDGAALTDDARLLSMGVKLCDTDLERLFDRNAGNFTMERLICDYAKQNDIRINRVPNIPNGDLIQTVRQVPYVAGKCVSWHTKPEFYEQFMGDNSDFARVFNG